MDWPWILAKIGYGPLNVIPWLLGLGTALLALSLSPLGRDLIRYLRSCREDAALAEATLHELGEVRALLGEIVERLDSTEGSSRGSSRRGLARMGALGQGCCRGRLCRW